MALKFDLQKVLGTQNLPLHKVAPVSGPGYDTKIDDTPVSSFEGPAEVFTAVLHSFINGAQGRTQYFTKGGTPRLPRFLELLDVALSIAQAGLTIALLVILVVEDELTYEFNDDSFVYYGWFFIGVPVAVKMIGILSDFGQRFDTIGDYSMLVEDDSHSITRVVFMFFGKGAKTRFVTFSQAFVVTLLTSLLASVWIAVLIHSVIEVLVKKNSFYLGVMLGLMGVLAFSSFPEANRHHRYLPYPYSLWPARMSCWRVLLGVFMVPAVAIVAALFMEAL